MPKIGRLNRIYALQNCVKLRSKSETRKTDLYDNKGDHMIKGGSYNKVHQLVLKYLDKANPYMSRHPKLAKVMLVISEKMLKNADTLKPVI